ncbi:MAG: CoA-binding protein [Longimicrobiales bacterium]|nr:CoA-binding protein [Longimicrobiales bacterium]
MQTLDDYDREALARVLSESSATDNPDADRIHRLVRRAIDIAVVGMSRDPSKAARRVPSYLAAKGANVIPVNPHADRILGKDARPTLADVTEPVDMVLVFRPSELAGAVVDQAAGRPERPIIWLQEGIRADEAAARAREQGLDVVQDLCMYKVHRALGDTRRRVEERGAAARGD